MDTILSIICYIVGVFLTVAVVGILFAINDSRDPNNIREEDR